MTYQQLCLLGLKSSLQKEKFDLRQGGWIYGEEVSPETRDLAQQALYRYQRQLLYSRPKEISSTPSIEVDVALLIGTSLSTVGQRLATRMSLQNTDLKDLRAVAAAW